MMSCCSLCYVKYLNEDGSVDWDVVREALPDGQELPTEEEWPRLPTGEMGPRGLCRCPCHVKGTEIIH